MRRTELEIPNWMGMSKLTSSSFVPLSKYFNTYLRTFTVILIKRAELKIDLWNGDGNSEPISFMGRANGSKVWAQ